MTSDNDPVARYLHLTRQIMPLRAAEPDTHWPVRNDHCFQRIVLDALCGGVWYDHLARPAYKHLTAAQAGEAVQICEDILTGRRDIHALNAQSLRWRGRLRHPAVRS